MPQQEEHFSEEAREILGRIPPWIVRWGITVVFIVFTGIIMGCYFIKFPDKISAPISLTTSNPPVELIARSTGLIDSIFVAPHADVFEGQAVGLIHNTADFDAIINMEERLTDDNLSNLSELSNADWLYEKYNLGELQNAFVVFTSACAEYKHYLTLNSIARRQHIIRNQIEKQKEYYQKQLVQNKLTGKDLQFEHSSHARDSILYTREVISITDYEQSYRSLIQKKSSKENLDAALISTELNILQMEQQLVELSIQYDEDINSLEQRINDALQDFKAQLKAWRYQYLFTSPIDGSITFTKYWAPNQTIKTGDRFASVVPTQSPTVLGRCVVPTNGFGKVAFGQMVFIKLNGYPYMEYGMLKGNISNISQVPEQGGYIVEISLPNDLVTTYKKQIPLIQEMDGVAEIITKDQRLIMRFIEPIRALFDD